MSFHGRYALNRQDAGEFPYLDEKSWMLIRREYAASGFGYSDYAGQIGYGISVTKPSWMAAAIEERHDIKLVCISEQARGQPPRCYCDALRMTSWLGTSSPNLPLSYMAGFAIAGDSLQGTKELL